MTDIKGITAKLINLTADEVNELVKVLKSLHKKESRFDVILSEAGPTKLLVVKDIYTFCKYGLKESKDLVNDAPSTLKENVSKKEAENLKKIIESTGAKITLRDKGKKGKKSPFESVFKFE